MQKYLNFEFTLILFYNLKKARCSWLMARCHEFTKCSQFSELSNQQFEYDKIYSFENSKKARCS